MLLIKPKQIQGRNMKMSLKELSSVMIDANKSAFKTSATRRAGGLFNDRVIGLIKPRLPMMVRSYADTEMGRFVIANAVAAAVIKFGGNNDKLLLLADAGVQDAGDVFLGSFDFEGMINGVIDGIDISGLTGATDTVREGTATVLRKASDVVEPSYATGGN